MGYHKARIVKGKLGEVDKIYEEMLEFVDAVNQNSPVLQLCELADCLGAIEAYTMRYYNISIIGLYKMTDATRRAFADGSRSET